MKFLVVLVSALACALAKPEVILSPHGFSYSTSAIHHPYHYSPYTYAAYEHHPYHTASPVSYATPVSYAAPVSVATAYHAQDAIGQASYGHAEAYQSHHAVQDAAGNKVGSYSYVTPEGKVVKTSYVADATGYKVASNALPVGPAYVPAPVVDTPEVAAAKAAHLIEVEKVKGRFRRDVPASTVKVGHVGHAVHPYAHHVSYSHPLAYTSYAHPHHAVYY